ncbi:MAG: PepSY-like domain-containing protein [Capnocytophaga sp.]|nr:PepSY-like domain-containing protein [Capnocytophaga sp.]
MKKSKIQLFAVMAFLFLGTAMNAQETIVTQNELPKEAQNFIKKYFANHTLDYITFERNYFSTNEYIAKFTDGLKLEFDGKGNWVEIDGKRTEIPNEFISKNILNYVKTKFVDTKIVRIEKGIFGRQEVKLSNGLELEFDSEGNFRRVDD